MKERGAFLSGKTAVVTGAAGGIGEYICEKLARDYGMNIVVTGRRKDALEKLAERLRAFGVKALVCACDLGEMAGIDKLITTAAESGGIDVLINNAGLAHNCAYEDVTPELFDAIMNINVRAPYFLCQKAIPYLRKSECATVINICSVTAHKGYPRQSAYAASKHALLGLSKSLANELYKDDIRVHVISPGGVFTDMVAVARPDLTSDGMIMPEDIANIVGFMLENRRSNAVVDEIGVHRAAKEPFA